MTHSKNSPPPPPTAASSGSPAVASAAGEHDEKPAKKPWSRPTFYVLTDVIESHGAPTGKTPGQEDETIPAVPSANSRYKSYRPTTA